MMERIELKPQAGPQEMFLETEADIALYGGAAGGGKSFALLLEPLRNVHNPHFGAVCFRRTMPQIKNEGGLWDESSKMYPLLNAKPNIAESFWKFDEMGGGVVSFAHLQYEHTIYEYQGAQIPLMLFDELTHFTKKQFFYMLSRNRSTCGVKPYIRCTTNPDKKSWVRKFIDWWIEPKLLPNDEPNPRAGLPIPSRSGVIRYFIVSDDDVIWRDKREDFDAEDQMKVKSFTFISAKITDNKILLQKDPGYLANLHSQNKTEKAKLLDGNWDAEEKAGEMFNRATIPVIEAVPMNLKKIVRYWDRASSEKPEADWTVGLKMGLMDDGKICVINMIRFQGRPAKVEAAITNAASQDGKGCEVCLEKDPGQAGEMEVQYLASKLLGYRVRIFKATASKLTRAGPVSSQASVGNVVVVAGPWNDDFFNELETFPTEGAKDDIVDTFSGGFEAIVQQKVGTFSEVMSNKKTTNKLGNW